MEAAESEINNDRQTCKYWTCKVGPVPHLFTTALGLHCEVELEEEADSQSVSVGLHSSGHTWW